MVEETPERHAAEVWALHDDENLIYLMTWRIVRERAEQGGFNGLLVSDFDKARVALGQLVAAGRNQRSEEATNG